MSPMADLEARAKRVLSPVLGHYTWLPVVRGEGSWLITDSGRRILDLTCGIAVTPVGHAHPKVVAAITEQASKLSHICAGVALYEPNVALAEALTKVTPAGLDTVFFGNSGAEAIEGALKLARQVTRRNAIIVFRGGFHGRSTGAMAVTTSKAAYRRGYGALLPDVYMAPFPYPLACPIKPEHDADTCAEHCLAELDVILEHHVPPEHVAAILIEPVLGEGGYVAPPPAFLHALRELATRIGAMLIFDEVQSGFGRTGAWFAAQKVGVTPDIMALAKALGGGLPLGAIVSSRELQDHWLPGTHGSTFGGNPVSCAAGLATLEIIRDEGLVARAERLGQQMMRELAPLRRDPHVRDISGFGAMVAVEFDDSKRSKAAIAAALERDVLLITCGFHDQAIRFIPPLNVSEADLSRGTSTLVEAVGSIEVATPA